MHTSVWVFSIHCRNNLYANQAYTITLVDLFRKPSQQVFIQSVKINHELHAQHFPSLSARCMYVISLRSDCCCSLFKVIRKNTV